MRFLVFVLCVAVLAVSVNSSPFWEETKSAICKPNEKYKKDCNTCKCSFDGTSSDCTNIDCYAESTRANQEAAVPITSETLKSKPVPYHSLLRQARQAHWSPPCIPGQPVQKGCNICACKDDATLGSCTRLPCNDPYV